jgi:thiosulfate/3-mercaptopyruvate sulfurtransferase
VLVDARSQLEHEGIVGTPCCDARGHIPGSVHFEWTNTVAATGDLTAPQRLEELLASAGIHPETDVIVYCHTNPRGALLALAMRHAGHPQTRLALGGLHEWSGRGFPVAPEQAE